MSMPRDIKTIDLMMGIPSADQNSWYDYMKPLFLDEESRNTFSMPAQYMFDVPELQDLADGTAYTLAQMDLHGIDRAMIGIIGDPGRTHEQAIVAHPDRFFASYECNPNLGMEEVRKIRRLHQDYGIKAVTGFPCGLNPQLPINDKRWYPIYAACVDLDIPICLCVGVPGPRLPMAPQKVEHLDEVCWFFPELKVVMRHGGEPWTELAWKLMLKYPNLYYSTSAFAPKHYPQDIIDFANSRGADKIMYAGYYPMGISLERIFSELPGVPFKDEVWPKFLCENARRVFKL
ncbi:MAG: amidohydrolase family protein [Halieaceae bacterium]